MGKSELMPFGGRDDDAYDYGLDPGESFEPEEDDEVFDLAQPHVMTVLGPIDPGALGFALHHEHVYRRPDPALVPDPDLWLDDPEAARQELEIFFAAGGRAVVDMSPADAGRDARVLLGIASHSPVHLVIVTGSRTDRFARPSIERGGDDVDAIVERNLRELREGTDGTAVKAGLITAGTSLDAITEAEALLLSAAGRSAVLSGAPVSTHTERGTMALEQVAALAAEGLAPSRIILGHLDVRLTDLPYLLDVCATGAHVSFDQWSETRYATDEERARVLVHLADAGHLDQLLVSGDLGRRSRHLSYGGQLGLAHFCDRVPLTLMDAGFDAPSVKRIFVDNPARALTIHRPAPARPDGPPR